MATKPFPVITETQVVLLRDDLYTGHVLDKDMNLSISEAQETWTVYNELSQAIEEANRIVKEYDFVECMIFDKDNKLISHITPE